jgi:hypothetical protein
LIYETRVLAFADLLGFSNLALTSPTDAKAMTEVDAVMNLLHKFKQENYELIQSHVEEVSFFSDCVVLSGTIDRLWYILREIGKLAREALAIGVPCRGGIATDVCYHRRELVVGPAMVKAYCMEQAAEYPRIVLDDRTLLTDVGTAKHMILSPLCPNFYAVSTNHMSKTDNLSLWRYGGRTGERKS